MLYLPPDPKPGEPIRASTITAILKYLRQITPRTGVNTNIQTGAGGSTMSVRHPRRLAGLLSGPSSRNLFVYDASTGSTPQISVTPGAFNGGIVPTLGGNPINAQIGSPSAWPVLPLSSGDTAVWFEITYNSSNVATSVLINHGTTIPTPNIVQGTAGTDYYGLSTVTVTTGPQASVAALNDYVSGNQGYAQCGNQSNCWLK